MMRAALIGRWGRNISWVATVGIGMAIAGCECEPDEPPLSQLQPVFSAFDPTVPEEERLELMRFDFGQVAVGNTNSRLMGIKNTGKAQMNVCLDGATLSSCMDATRLDPESSPFGFTFGARNPDTGAWEVNSAQEKTFEVTFSPQVEGDASAVLLIVHNGTNGPVSMIELIGNGVEPTVDFSTDRLDFGPVTVDKQEKLDLVLTNPTPFAATVRVPALDQPSVIFGIIRQNGEVVGPTAEYEDVVPANGQLSVSVFFQPPEEGQFENTMTVSYCPAETCRQVVTLTGQGVKPSFELDPANLDFGVIDEGVAEMRSFVARNIGNVPLTVISVGRESGTSDEFDPQPGQSLPHVLQPGEELTVDVTYLGTTPGEDTGRIEVVTDAWDDPNTPTTETIGYVTLLATSLGPDINAFPPTVNFGTVGIMGTPATRMLIIENVGNAALTVNNITFNTMTPEITITGIPGLPMVVDAGNSINLTLTYAPVDAGADTAEVVVDSNDRDEATLTVPVTAVGGVPTTCSINVAPSVLTFGLVERGRTATLPVEIRNAGAQPCTLSNVRLTGAPEFGLASGGVQTVNVAPGANHRIDISYSPTAYGSHNTLLEFEADDPAQAMIQVPVSGASEESDILVIPSQLDFNVVPVLCNSGDKIVTVYNTGGSSINITNVYLDPTTSPEFVLTPVNTPQALPAGGQTTISVRYQPQDIGPDTGLLFIGHSSGIAPVAVPLQGEGQINPTVTDVFNQVPTPAADVLFVVDNSCSMSEEQSSLGQNLGFFLQFAQTEGIDYQIGVTTTDVGGGGEQGAFVGPFITTTTPNADTLFQQQVNQGTNGSGIEQGLEAAYLALSDPLINTTNAGFLRTDAALAVIWVSDEEDQSNRNQPFYENFLRNIKGFQNSGQFSASAIVGSTPGGCSSGAGDADYGQRYVVTANNTGGVVESICNANWGQTLANIGLNSFGLKRQFQLSSTPVAVTIAIRVNGTQVPSVTPGGQTNWNYDVGSNSVIFATGAVPPAGASLEITYTVACLP